MPGLFRERRVRFPIELYSFCVIFGRVKSLFLHTLTRIVFCLVLCGGLFANPALQTSLVRADTWDIIFTEATIDPTCQLALESLEKHSFKTEIAKEIWIGHLDRIIRARIPSAEIISIVGRLIEDAALIPASLLSGSSESIQSKRTAILAELFHALEDSKLLGDWVWEIEKHSFEKDSEKEMVMFSGNKTKLYYVFVDPEGYVWRASIKEFDNFTRSDRGEILFNWDDYEDIVQIKYRL